MPKRKRTFSSTVSTVTNYVSVENGTTIPTGTYDGTYVYVSQYNAISLTILASDKSGTGTISYSFDGEVEADSSPFVTVAGTALFQRFPCVFPYAKVTWASDDTLAPAVLNIYTVFDKEAFPQAGDITLNAGDGIGIAGSAPTYTISNTDKGSDVSLAGQGGGAIDLVSDGTGPVLGIKTLQAGANVVLTEDTPNLITVTASAPPPAMYMAGMAIGEIKYNDVSGSAYSYDTAGGDPFIIAPTTTLTTTQDLTSTDFFSSPQPGRLTYIGSATKLFHTAVSISGTASSINEEWHFTVLKDNLPFTDSTYLYTTKQAGDKFDIAFHVAVPLSTNNYLEVRGELITAGTSILTINNFNLIAVGDGDSDVFANTTLSDAGAGTYSAISDGAGPAMALKTIDAGTGITVGDAADVLTITNAAPDQTVSLTAGTGIIITGSYPNFLLLNHPLCLCPNP